VDPHDAADERENGWEGVGVVDRENEDVSGEAKDSALTAGSESRCCRRESRTAASIH
jgi:hypothetical protein